MKKEKTVVMIFHPQVAASTTQQFLVAAAKPLADVMLLRMQHAADCSKVTEQLKEILPHVSRVIWQFPLYWYSAPAIFHVWVEQYLDEKLKKLFANKEIGVVVSLGKLQSHYHIGASENVTVDQLLLPYATIACKCHAMFIKPLVVEPLLQQSLQEQYQLAIDYQQYLQLPNNPTIAQRGKWFLGRLECAEAISSQLFKEWLQANVDEVADLKDMISQTRQKG